MQLVQKKIIESREFGVQIPITLFHEHTDHAHSNGKTNSGIDKNRKMKRRLQILLC